MQDNVLSRHRARIDFWCGEKNENYDSNDIDRMLNKTVGRDVLGRRVNKQEFDLSFHLRKISFTQIFHLRKSTQN